ncbi:hypothetical protein [Nocardia araoensis]|uniref:hypothetical protein n=1 Tax=Nocardia araoensis TaxID=228600 RepID=UPI0012F6B52F|nr:hypothetical protein [Nocardia araoensis]
MNAAFIVSIPINWFAVTKYLMLDRRALSWNFSPVFAMTLPRWLVFAGNVCAPIGVSATLLLAGAFPVLQSCLVCLLIAVWLLCKNLRISNHSFLVVVTIMVLVFVDDGASAASAISAVLAALYAAAGIAKMNRAYMFGPNSVGKKLVDLNFSRNSEYLSRTPEWVRRTVHIGAMFVIPAMEISLAAMIMVGVHLVFCLVTGLVLHFFFGISGNWEFTSVAVSIWLVLILLAESASISDVISGLAGNGLSILLYLLCVGLSTALWQCTWQYRSRRAGLVNEIVSAVYFGLASAAAIVTVENMTFVKMAYPVFFAVLAGTLGAVLVGARMEFAFAMLSNLRPYGDAWIFLAPRPLLEPKYFFLRLPNKIPISLFTVVPIQFIKSATSGEFVVHISTAVSLAKLFRRHGATLLACRAVPDPDRGRMVLRAESDGPEWVDLSTTRAQCQLFPPLVPAELALPVMG